MVRAPGTLPIARVIIESSPLSTARMASKYNDDNVLEERVVKRTKKEARRDRKGGEEGIQLSTDRANSTLW